MALIDVTMPSEFHLHLHADAGLLAAVDRLTTTLAEGFHLMADRAQQLTDAVNNIATHVDTATTSLQTEIQQIVAKLDDADDAALRAAVDDAVPRLQTVAQNLDALNTTIQGIVPDEPTPPTV